jgi:hypothetical protein
MPFSGIWRRVVLVLTEVSEECFASIFRVENPRAKNQHEQVAADKSMFTKELHGTTSQKTAFFIITALKTSDPTYMLGWSDIMALNTGS